MKDWKIVMTAIICIMIIEVVALLKGIDGTMLAITVGLIGAAAGIIIPLDKVKGVFKNA